MGNNSHVAFSNFSVNWFKKTSVIFLKNDFFMEAFCASLVTNPLELSTGFQKNGLVKLKTKLLSKRQIDYTLDSLLNKHVVAWLSENKDKYTKVVLVTASPQSFARKILSDNTIFDEIYGSTDVNLKSKNKLAFIIDKFGDEFIYIGDSKADNCLFEKARIALKVNKQGLSYVKNSNS